MTPAERDDGPVEDGPIEGGPIDDEPEVVVPDEVTGAEQPPPVRPDGRPDRRPEYALYGGLGSLVFLLVFPLPLLVLGAALVGIWFGRKVMAEIDPSAGPSRARKRAKTGFVAGIATMVVYAALVTYAITIYEPPEKEVAPVTDKESGQPVDEAPADEEPAG